MLTLAEITILTGLCLVALGLPPLLSPRRFAAFLERFPRNRVAGCCLATVALLWVVRALFNAQFNWVDEHRRLIYILTPVAWVMVLFFMDELLAPRALGGLFLLAPMPILDAAFMETSPWRLIMVSLAYLLAIVGMVLVWSPYMFRKTVARWMTAPKHYYAVGGGVLLSGLLLTALGLFGY